jgi:hypothetical protein
LQLGSETRSEILTQKGAKHSIGYLRHWKYFVDAASFVWLSAFVVSLLSYSADFVTVAPAILEVTDTVSLLLLPVFVADLVLKYRLTGCSKTFFRNHWISVVTVVPYFRIFKILSVVRLAGLVRLGAIPRVWSVLLNAVKAVYKALNFGRR